MPVLKNHSNWIVAALLLATWIAIAFRYYGPADPLTDAEIDGYMDKVQHMFTTVIVPDDSGIEIDPLQGLNKALGELRAFAESDNGKPFYMINMMKWRQAPLLPPGVEFEGDVNDADARYNDMLFANLARNASHTAFLGSALPNALNYGTSAENDNWGDVGIFRYSSRRDFFEMISSEDYRNIVYFKLAAMGQVALVPTQVHGLALNPMPNLPVLLAGGGLVHRGHVVCPAEQHKRVPLSNLWLSVLHWFGSEAKRFGRSTGTFSPMEIG